MGDFFESMFSSGLGLAAVFFGAIPALACAALVGAVAGAVPWSFAMVAAVGPMTVACLLGALMFGASPGDTLAAMWGGFLLLLVAALMLGGTVGLCVGAGWLMSHC